MNKDLSRELAKAFKGKTPKESIEAQQEIAEIIFESSPLVDMPIANVRWVPIEKVHANDYNPNSVAAREMLLLYTSIKHDGYTQPIVTIYDESQDLYIIVDGFHRWTTMKKNKDILESCHGFLPIVVLKKDINDRMASTVRHNRARGKHSVAGMGSMVLEMLKNGWEDAQICAELGMEADELVRLKHVTGFSKLFEDVTYRKAWERKRQLLLKRDFKKNHPEQKTMI